MASDVDRIKERLGIVDVLSSYIQLENAGMGHKARCPFHGEKTPSFHVSSDRGLYYCFGCGAKGDMFTFVQDFENVDFTTALTMLADKAGIELQGGPSQSQKDDRKELFDALERATLFFQIQLGESREAREYLEKRSINSSTVEAFRIGYAPDAWNHLHGYLLKAGISEDVMQRAGLIKRKGGISENSAYDRFRDRIIFPITDTGGRVVGFSGRALRLRDNVAKYINSPETVLYNKSDILFGYDKAKHHIKKANRCILVEGQVDLVLLHQEGFPYSVAVSGTSFTGAHLKTLSRLSNNLVIAFDRDRAGIISMARTASMALGMGMDVRTILLPEGKDPADIVSNDASEWKEYVKNAKHVVDVFLYEIRKNIKDERDYWLRVMKHVLPLISDMSNTIDQAHFIKRVREETDIPEKAIRSELEKMKVLSHKEMSIKQPERPAPSRRISRKDSIVQTLYAIIAWQSEKNPPVVNVQDIADKIQLLSKDSNIDKPGDEEIHDLIFKVEHFYSDTDELKSDIEELLLGLEEECITENLTVVTKDIRASEHAGNAELTKDLLQKHHHLSHELDIIKQKIKSRIS